VGGEREERAVDWRMIDFEEMRVGRRRRMWKTM